MVTAKRFKGTILEFYAAREMLLKQGFECVQVMTVESTR